MFFTFPVFVLSDLMRFKCSTWITDFLLEFNNIVLYTVIGLDGLQMWQFYMKNAFELYF